jgi:MFS superfamily sulfate permease-like transporter
VTICSSQVRNFLGLDGPKGKGIINVWRSIISNISTAKIGDSVMGISCVGFLFAMKVCHFVQS